MRFDFKNINVVPIGNEFVDLILSRVHHQTPTLLLRKGFKINRLRQFYTRKVKKTELCYRDKLSTIIDEFPRVDEIHPFFSDLLRSILDRDQYKSALGQVNTAMHLISEIGNDYVNLLEFAESLTLCKSLKASAIGGMYSVVNEITPSLAYLEQLRQHMVRLPSIDPDSPSLLISGYPNVDKARFINRINTEAGEVTDDFTTESVNFALGHTDYEDLRYQVIDAPKILDRPLSGDCRVITALACHLRASLVVFFLDVSESCGYSIAHQAVFFHSLKSLFWNKRLLIVCDETDLMQISEQDWDLIEEMVSGMGTSKEEEEEEEVGLMISNLRTEEGMMSVKNAACERLLDHRERLISCVPQTKAKILRNKYILAHQEWKQDIIPDEDHKDSDLMAGSGVFFRLEELEREEELKQAVEEEEDFVVAEERFKLKQAEEEEEEEEEEEDFVVAEERFKLKQAEEEEEEEEDDDDFVMAEERFKLKQAEEEEEDDDFVMAEERFKLKQAEEEEEEDDEFVMAEERFKLKQAGEEEEEDDFVMAEERFTENHKDQLVSIRKFQPLRMLVALAFVILVGNTYGAIQQCLSALSF